MFQEKKGAIEPILKKAVAGFQLEMDEIALLLSLNEISSIEKLHHAARIVRSQHFGNQIFTYSFIYFSTHCRNNCTFCHFRASNTDLRRYRKSTEEILETARLMTDAGVNLIDLTMGEDPRYFHQPDGLADLVEIVAAIHNETGLPVMISPGVVPESLFPSFKDAGAIFYACYQETHNRTLFDTMRQGQSYDERLNSKLSAKRAGLLIEEGLLCGIGDTMEDTAHSMFAMQSMDADQVRAMTFVPQEGTPLDGHAPGTPLKELLTISVMRLLFPDRLIPASLDVDGLAGLKARLDAGANVVTSLVPPDRGLAGVAHASLDIDDARRTPESILPILEACDLQPASNETFTQWVAKRVTKTAEALSDPDTVSTPELEHTV